MVIVAAKLFDPLGYLEFEPLPTSTAGDFARRASKVATLDGGIVVTDRGFSYGDTEISYDYTPISLAHDEIARRLVSLHSTVLLSNEHGLFEAIPGPFNATAEVNTFAFSIVAKLDEE